MGILTEIIKRRMKKKQLEKQTMPPYIHSYDLGDGWYEVNGRQYKAAGHLAAIMKYRIEKNLIW